MDYIESRVSLLAQYPLQIQELLLFPELVVAAQLSKLILLRRDIPPKSDMTKQRKMGIISPSD